MAHFRGTITGTRGEASRLGTKNSGLRVEAQSWQGKVVVTLTHDEATGRDMATVTLATHGTGGAESRTLATLFHGPVSGHTPATSPALAAEVALATRLAVR